MRIAFRLFIILFAFVALKSFTGCGGSEEAPEESEETKTKNDSIQVYGALENARLHYTKALSSNEKGDSKSSKEEFEAAVKLLYKISSNVVSKHSNWNKDFEELSRSVSEDYIISADAIPSESKVFKLADRVGVKYQKVEKKSYSTIFDPADLPKGEDIRLDTNSSVDDYITYFQGNGRKYMDKWLYRSGKYFNLMRSILRQNNAPEELIYLSMIESGLDPTISSWAGAIGLWQFMPATGTAYGLYYDDNTDDKRDVEKSTDAAARLLNDLYKSFGNWYLALASYNAGPGRINSAVQKAGTTDFWQIRDYLPKETRNYVPQFIACALINIDPKKYGFNDVEYGAPLEYDRVIIKAQVPLTKIAELCNTTVENIRDLNPQLLKDETPIFQDGYLIKIPKGSFKEFAKNYEDAGDIDRNGFKAAYDGDEGTASADNSSSYSYYRVEGYNVENPKLIISQSNRQLVFHQLADSEDLKTVSIKYGVRPTDIRIWNNIFYGTYPKKGDSLSVWLTDAKYKELYGVKDKLEENETGDVKQNDTKTNETKDVIEKPQKKDGINDNNQNNTDEELKAKDVLVRKDQVKNYSKNDDEQSTEPKKKTEKKDVVTKTERTKTEKTKTEKKSKGTYQTYTVKSGDNLSKIADSYDVDIADIKDWNDLESDNIIIGQKLKIYSPEKVTETISKKKKANKIEYKVKSGDNLTGIADKYDVDVADIKDWNDLESDKIEVGQSLTIYTDKKTTTSTDKKKGKLKTYTVQEGDNLTAIADDNGVTVSQIKDWNDLESDVIQTGQVLKLYSSKETKKETSKDTKKKSKTQYHTVKKGETLASIADKYDCTVTELKKWNGLKKDVIEIGQKLQVSK